MIPELAASAIDWTPVLALVFGGCCSYVQTRTDVWTYVLIALLFSNVFALEAVLKSHPNGGRYHTLMSCHIAHQHPPGIFLTFVQFAYVTLQTLSSQFTFAAPSGETTKRSWIPRLKPRVVPLRRWIVQVILFLAVSLMNNWAFGLKVPVPIHIIFRSGGESQGCLKVIRSDAVIRFVYLHADGMAGRWKTVRKLASGEFVRQ